MSNQQRSVSLLVTALGYVVKFIACGFMTPVVLMTFAALISTYLIVVGPEMPFLKYLSFLLPIDRRGNASIDGNDIMRAYGLLTMALFVFFAGGQWLIRLLRRAAIRVFQPETEADEEAPANGNLLASLKRRLIVSSIVITVIYLAVFVVIPSAHMAGGTSSLAMYPVFIIFYGVAMISNALFIGIDSLSNLMLGWGWSRVVGG